MCGLVSDDTIEAQVHNQTHPGRIPWWGIGIGAGILYIVLVFTLGLMTLRNGHGWMFFFGIFFPNTLDRGRLHEAAGDRSGALGAET